MTTIVFKMPGGDEKRVTASDGHTIMETAVANGIPGIRGECGGSLACATCHVYVDDAFADRVGASGDMEADMLDFAEDEVRPESRLCCQIKVSPAIDGIVLHVPAA